MKEYQQAFKESLKLLESGDYSASQAREVLLAISKEGSTDDWYQAFNLCASKYTFIHNDRDVLEQFGQQVLQETIKHPSFIVRFMSLIALGLASDMRCSSMVFHSLNDDNAMVRSMAIEMAAHYGTQELIDGIIQSAEKDSSCYVRAMAYRIGALVGLSKLKPILYKVLKSRLTDGFERREALKALASLSSDEECLSLIHNVSYEDLDSILLICEILSVRNFSIDSLFFSKLLDIENADIQEIALFTALRMGKDYWSKNQDFITRVSDLAINSPFLKVSLASAVFLYWFNQDEIGVRIITQSLKSSDCEIASCALSNIGIRGSVLAGDYITKVASHKSSVDLSIIALLSSEKVKEAGDVLKDFLVHPYITPAIEKLLLDRTVTADITSPLQIEMLEKEIGRRVIRLLVTSGYSNVDEAIRIFQKRCRSYMYYSNAFWEEFGFKGDITDHTSELHFLNMLEFALEKFYLNKDRDSLEDLKQLYPKCSWREKLRILEAIASSENSETIIPFLIQCCRDSIPSIRAASAGALFSVLK